MLSILAAVREREILKLVFTFDHVNYIRYNSNQHVFLTEEKRLNSPAYQDLKHYVYGASLTGCHFSGLHGDWIVQQTNKGNSRPIQIRL